MRLIVPCIAVALALAFFAGTDSIAQGDAKKDAPSIQGIDAIRLLFRSGKINEAEQFIYVELWDDIRQPEAMHILAQIMMRKKQREVAATWYRLLMRIAEDYPSAESDKFKSDAEKFLRFGEKEHQQAAAAYVAQAGGKFPGPDKVGDGWMTQVAADLHGLKALQAWAYIDGHPQVQRGDSMWIHTQKSAMHRSGLKWNEEVDGRKGVLFGVPHPRKAGGGDDKKGPADITKEAPKAGAPAATRITYIYPGKGKVLRIGTKMWGSPFRIEVKAGGKTLLEQSVEGNAWSDLSATLPADLKKGDRITLDLILPQATNHIHGVWIDYIDVFDE